VLSSQAVAFDPFSIDLPVTAILQEVRGHLRSSNTLLVNAPPGAGKSTLLPLALLDEEWLGARKIILLEPRRLAARAIATRMAELLGEQTGETVGYRIRFESRVSAKTRIEVVTEGILTRMLQTDNALEQASLVIFDEFHERSLHADLALALCRECQQVLRPELRILVMSATLDMPHLTSLLNCPTVKSEGRQYPVEVIYNKHDADPFLLPEFAARMVVQAFNEKPGDILLFLPGEAEIKKCAELVGQAVPGLSVHPLYGQLPPQEQQNAIIPHRQGRRKIVLATSIAETSLTIEGVRVVIDCGFSRVSRFDPGSGLTRLETVRVSKDSAEQRAGRAGRLSAGYCYRMWTAATHSRLAEQRIPEILEADLAPLVLETTLWGVKELSQLSWLTPPPTGSTAQAYDILEQLGAIEDRAITSHGKAMHNLACHPRIAHMLLMASDLHAKQLATDIAAVLEERDPLQREAGADLNLRIEALRNSRRHGKASGRFTRIEKLADSYRKMLKAEADNSVTDPHMTGLLLAFAYPERIAAARPGNNAQFQLSNGRYAMIGHQDDLAHEPWLAVAHMDLRSGLGKIFLAAPLNPKDLLPMVKEKEVVTWDTRRGGLIANKELRLGNLVLQAKPLDNPGPQLVATAILNAIKEEGESLLDFNEEVTQLQNRIMSLKIWNAPEAWPEVTTDELLRTAAGWLSPYLDGVKRPEDLKKIDLSEALKHSLSWESQQQLEQLAPSKIEVPSGSKIKLQYFNNGASPVLAVRLQEVFGVADTPTVNNGKIKVVMHLLSPGYKPVQVTSDLRSFWNNLYFEIKKELQRRYPKHSWPDDPWSAKAVAKGRSHK
jgi:ATP-dependent helicase HrpB